jgi:Ser/Thr protein kinase RdoA (MazF antagonist)
MDLELKEVIENAYNLDTIESVEVVEKGVLSENWFLTADGERYFLKKYRFDEEKRIREIHAAKQFFADHGIPVILPIPTRTGTTYLKDQDTYFALFPFISARQLERGELSDMAIASMGRMLGKIHLAGKGSTLDIDKEGFKVWNDEKFVQEARAYLDQIAQIPEPTPFDELARQDLELKLSRVRNDSRQYADFDLAKDHLIQGDYLDHNLFFDEKDEVSHVFDFEKAQYASRSYELIRSLLYCVMEPDLSQESLRRAKLYIDAYQGIYPISADELRKSMEVFFLKSIRGLWMHKELYMLKNRRPEQFLAPEIARTSFLAEHRSELMDALVG